MTDDLIPLKTRLEIEETIDSVCRQLVRDEAVKDYTALVLMEGAERFFNTLATTLESTYGQSFKSVVRLTLKSYCDTESSGTVQGLEQLDINSLGDKVIIIDDILDTGCTLDATIDFIRGKAAGRDALSILSCVLFLKETNRRSNQTKCSYYGMSIPDCFVIGYGLDYNGQYRELDGLFTKAGQNA